MTTRLPYQTCATTKPPRQQGFVLIIALIMLIIVSILGIAGVRLAATEERMVAQTYDRATAFQAAEAALREAEALIESSNQPVPAAGVDCSAQSGTGGTITVQVCGVLMGTSTTPRWLQTGTTADGYWATASEVGNTSSTVKITPQYFVEYLGNNFPCAISSPTATNNCKRYRITARVNPAADGRSKVVLQSIYATY